MRFTHLLVLVILFAAGWQYLELFPYPTPGILAPDEPGQVLLAPGEVKSWTYHDCSFKPLAKYSLKARILHRASYYFDQEAVISPLDLALGWGRMSDPVVYGKLHVSQSGRWYTWYYWGNAPIPDDEIVHSSANTHIIPENSEISDRLYWLRTGDVVALSGYLVQVTSRDGRIWTSSLSRTDTGDGSCEVMWVNSVDKVGR